MPKFPKLTTKNLPQHLDDSAESHNGHGWETFLEIMKVGEKLNFNIRPTDVGALYGVTMRTASSWIELYKSKESK